MVTQFTAYNGNLTTAKEVKHSALYLNHEADYRSIYIYICIYSESTEPIDDVNILPPARFEPTTSATPPSTTPDINATTCATETSPKKDVQEALILTTTDAVHVVHFRPRICPANSRFMCVSNALYVR